MVDLIFAPELFTISEKPSNTAKALEQPSHGIISGGFGDATWRQP